LGTLALSYFGIKHKESFNQEIFDFLNKDVFPIINQHIRNKVPNALNTASHIAKLIHDFLKQETSSSRMNSGFDCAGGSSDSNPTVKGNTENKAYNDSHDHNEPESEESVSALTADISSNNSHSENSSIESSNEKPTICKETSGCDVSSLMAKQIEKDSIFIPPTKSTIGEYQDTIANLSDPKCFSMSKRANTDLYQLICSEYKSVILSYRNMFGIFLISTSRSRLLKTFAGKFNHRDVSHVASSPNPRIFTRRIEGRQFGYDVSLLMDCSGSMGGFSNDILKGCSKIEKAYKTLVILAEALHGLSGINLEILAFTADSQFKPGWSVSKCKDCNNQLFILKSFNDHSTGALAYFPSYHTEYNFSRNNFDIGAIKLSSRRLRQMPSDNKKLLIVLSDGQPSSEISCGTDLLKSYVEELSRIHPIMGIGLNNPDIDKYYPGGININDLSELNGLISNSIKNFLVKQTKFSKCTDKMPCFGTDRK